MLARKSRVKLRIGRPRQLGHTAQIITAKEPCPERHQS